MTLQRTSKEPNKINCRWCIEDVHIQRPRRGPPLVLAMPFANYVCIHEDFCNTFADSSATFIKNWRPYTARYTLKQPVINNPLINR